MPILKEDLLGDHYFWNTDGDAAFTGNPSRRLFDRFNGEQVLFIINSYGSVSGTFTIQEGRNIEELLWKQLPIDAKSEISVFNWLRVACQ